VGPAADPPEDAGVPFYVKTAVCRHQTVYDEPHFTVTLILEQQFSPDPEKAGRWEETGRESVTLSLGGLNAAQSAGLLAPGNEREVKEHFASLRGGVTSGTYPPPAMVSSTTGLPSNAADYALVANRSDPEVIVDYSRMFYVNTRRTSWSGSTNATVELAPDGTLSKAEASLEDTTLKTVLEALPVSAFASKILHLTTPAEIEKASDEQAKAYVSQSKTLRGLRPDQALPRVPPILTRARLEVAPTVIRHRFWVLTNAYPESYVGSAGAVVGCVCATPHGRLNLSVPNVSYEQVLVNPSASSTAAVKKEDENTITLLGSIRLPKASEAKKENDKK